MSTSDDHHDLLQLKLNHLIRSASVSTACPEPREDASSPVFDTSADTRLVELIRVHEPYHVVPSSSVAQVWHTIASLMKRYFDHKSTALCRVSGRICQNRFKSLLCRHKKRRPDHHPHGNAAHAALDECVADIVTRMRRVEHAQPLPSAKNRRPSSSSTNVVVNTSSSRARIAAQAEVKRRRLVMNQHQQQQQAQHQDRHGRVDQNEDFGVEGGESPVEEEEDDTYASLRTLNSSSFGVDEDELRRELAPGQVRKLYRRMKSLAGILEEYLALKRLSYSMDLSEDMDSASKSQDTSPGSSPERDHDDPQSPSLLSALTPPSQNQEETIQAMLNELFHP